MSVDILRRAAALMRERAIGAQEQGNVAWATMPTIYPDNDGWVVVQDIKDADWDTTVARTPYDYDGTEVAPHIASWHPAVALAVAKALDDVALAWEMSDNDSDGWVSDLDNDAIRFEETVDAGWLAVARTYLGETEPTT